jgi:hypothetical protein
MNISISNSYVLTHQLRFATNYKWTKDGKCFNSRTGREIKKVLCGRSVGYCIKGKFQSVNTLRPELELIPEQESPF